MPQIGPAEILVILLVGLLVFGPKKLPEIGRQVGRGLHELRRLQETVRGELDGVLNYQEDEPPAVSSNGSSNGHGAGAVSAAEAPPALPPVEADTPPAPKGGARPPSRFRAPGSQPTT